jgi:tetratricopeptide (TPR) repeat protein
MADFAQHEPELSAVGRVGGFAQIRVKGGEQCGLVCHERVPELAKLGATELHWARRTGLEKGPLALHYSSGSHNLLGSTCLVAYKAVKQMIRWLAILILFPAVLARADVPAERLTVAGIAEFTVAYKDWDAQRFRAAADLFRRASTNAPATATNYYWLGVAEFHRMLQLQTAPGAATNTVAANAAMDAALAALQSAVRLDERHAESHALLGTIYGMKIDGNLLRAARFGPRVGQHQRKALEFGAQNPRVRYLLGTCQFHTAKQRPAQEEALATLLLADKLFAIEAQQAAGPLEPRWGRSSCLTFIGRTYELLGQQPEATAYFRKALAEHPADHVAQEGLARVGKP